MESTSSQPQRVTPSTNAAIPVPSQNAATQIYLIKEEIASPIKKGSTVVNYADPTDHEIVRISPSAAGEHLTLVTSEPSTMIVPKESINKQTEKKVVSEHNVLPVKKKRQSSKGARTASKKVAGQYTCEKCKKSYVHEASLKAHVRRTYCQENKSLVSSSNFYFN